MSNSSTASNSELALSPITRLIHRLRLCPPSTKLSDLSMPGESRHHVEDVCLVGNTLVIGYGAPDRSVETQIETLDLNEFVNGNVLFSHQFLRIRANAHCLCRTGYFFETPCFTLHIVIGGSALWRLLIIGVSYLVATTNVFICGRSPPTHSQSRRMT